ncbi:RagB/SusD family nutrient uptake outer membrane protein [Chitinophaga horti]|uniref:RagB/SusD family nutrient uptake outer membrane protein n=1 Tax=Chitinophaga horti TaxID=2920382 RepID=A0ABY6JBD0_9BACT|nr:RagB/SusD family nutrient uptake outer membrane protein [Chitinophaga horti]UYQ95887.1 RagB/SusD family nutrient uptake outer membrane protein [Chitinophaga horti]
MKNVLKHITHNTTIAAMLAVGAVCMMPSCSKSFLKPEPTTFLEPDATFTTRGGLDAAVATADRHLRSYWTYFEYTDLSLPISTEYMFSDVAVASKTDDGNIFVDIATRLTPTDLPERVSYFWNETYNGIKYANTVLTYIDGVKEFDEATKNQYRGRAMFHRAFRYLALCFQFKDVPLVTQILKKPKVDYQTTSREAILQMITSDMEKAVEWVPEQRNMSLVGLVNKGACRQLLIKCYLATKQYDKAIEQADILINNSGYSLMTANFGNFIAPYSTTWPVTRNVIWDLHRPENKAISANRETIMVMLNRNGVDAGVKMNTMRNWLPWLDGTNTLAPDGKQAVRYVATSNSIFRAQYDYTHALGRGIAHIRPTHYATNSVWYVNGVNDATDLRHNSTVGNWARVDSMKYNDPSSTWFGRNVRLYHPTTNALLCADTIRCFFDWPHYKYYVEDPLETQARNEANHRGGAGDWYLYRLAETYLLRAEAKFYKGDPTAVNDVNIIRQRAGCTQLFTTVTIGDIMDERARELNMEEWRFTEMSRVSYCLAHSGKPDEWGNTYNPETLDQNSYWYQRIQHHNNYYNKGKAVVRNRAYTMAPHNINWPIPQYAIDANGGRKLHQNPNYSGYDPSVTMFTSWEEAVADESK